MGVGTMLSGITNGARDDNCLAFRIPRRLSGIQASAALLLSTSGTRLAAAAIELRARRSLSAERLFDLARGPRGVAPWSPWVLRCRVRLDETLKRRPHESMGQK